MWNIGITILCFSIILIQLTALPPSSLNLHHPYESINEMLHKMTLLPDQFPSSRGLGNHFQSLTILMNFGNDGKSSMVLMNYDSVLWSDAGFCRHGQVYDPVNRLCRDIFCVEGYYLTPQGCAVDLNETIPICNELLDVPDEIQIQMTLNYEHLVDNTFYNAVDNSSTLLKERPHFIDEFKIELSKIIHIQSSQLQNIKIKNSAKHCILTEDRNETDQILETISLALKLVSSGQNGSAYTTVQIFYDIFALSFNKVNLLINNKRVYLTDVIQFSRNSSRTFEWCEEPHQKVYYTDEMDKFSLYASFEEFSTDRNFYIYIKENNTLYKKGDYYLSILFKDPHVIATDFINKKRRRDVSSQDKLPPILQNLTDMTSVVLANRANVSTFLVVCNRHQEPVCDTYTTVRIKICELDYFVDSKRFCWPSYMTSYFMMRSNNHVPCYNEGEYEYDRKEPNVYIRVCSSLVQVHDQDEEPKKSSQSETNQLLASEIPAWLSLIATMLSLVCMILTLLAYFFLQKLRNIPGWNMVNLILALIVAQFCFLFGSFVSYRSKIVCFLVSIATHYGYLSSFFWMNVIAFDMYRNFSRKRSHILINTLNVKSRIAKYSFYTWGSAAVIVLIALIVDVSVDESFIDAPFRPCYASYLSGCNIIDIIEKKNQYWAHVASQNSSIVMSASCKSNSYHETITKMEYFFKRSCWIKNGRANLIFFGLPIGLIIIINAIFYFVTIFNIQKTKNSSRRGLQDSSNGGSVIRHKLIGDDHQVKFYVRMAIIMGFQWVTGFLMTSLAMNDDTESGKHLSILDYIFIYVYVLANGLIGVFIFVSFICKNEIRKSVVKKFKSCWSKIKNRGQQTSQEKISADTRSTILASSIRQGSDSSLII